MLFNGEEVLMTDELHVTLKHVISFSGKTYQGTNSLGHTCWYISIFYHLKWIILARTILGEFEGPLDQHSPFKLVSMVKRY